MDKGSQKRPRDANKLAKLIVEIATGEKDDTSSEASQRARKAGEIGGRARADALTPEVRSEIARVAANARWKKDD